MKFKNLWLPLLLIFLSGASNGLMDANDHHQALSSIDWKGWIDVEKHWWMVFGFTYGIEDIWHGAKLLMGIFLALTLIVTSYNNKYLSLQQNYLLGIKRIYFYTLAMIVSWWVGFLVIYKVIL